MIEHNGIELLVHRLISLTEAAGDDEGKAVFNTLSIFENMVEVKPEVGHPHTPDILPFLSAFPHDPPWLWSFSSREDFGLLGTSMAGR